MTDQFEGFYPLEKLERRRVRIEIIYQFIVMKSATKVKHWLDGFCVDKISN